MYMMKKLKGKYSAIKLLSIVTVIVQVIVGTCTTIYGSTTTSTRQVKRLRRRYFFAFLKF